jgi:hypothetical protein
VFGKCSCFQTRSIITFSKHFSLTDETVLPSLILFTMTWLAIPLNAAPTQGKPVLFCLWKTHRESHGVVVRRRISSLRRHRSPPTHPNAPIRSLLHHQRLGASIPRRHHHSINTLSPDFFTLRVFKLALDVTEIHLRMAEHVRRKLLQITSILATETAYHVICTTGLSSDRLDEGNECGFFPCVW